MIFFTFAVLLAVAQGQFQGAPCPGGGERLYNNLCLPDTWPPRERYSRTPVTPPPPPDTIDVTVGRQLFVDGWLTAETNATRTWHAAKEVAGNLNPVVKATRPWENGLAFVYSGGAWFDPAAPTAHQRFCRTALHSYGPDPHSCVVLCNFMTG